MACGKSSLALQHHYHQSRRGREGLLLTCGDRSGTEMITSRTGMQAPARGVEPETDIIELVSDVEELGYLVIDEAQFLTYVQVEQVAWLVDHRGIEVTCLGLTTDFRTSLFEGSRRLLELADVVQRLQVQGLCWCGEIATHNARVDERGVVARNGEAVLLGDTTTEDAAGGFYYELLCRKHHLEGDAGPAAGA